MYVYSSSSRACFELRRVNVINMQIPLSFASVNKKKVLKKMPIGSMRLVYLPTFTIILHHSCR